MKILMVSSFLPYPLFSGGQIRLFNLIKELSSKHEITLICEKRSSQTVEDISQVERICKKVITVDRRKQWSVRNLLKTGFSNNSFLFNGHLNLEMRSKIQKELDEKKFDLIHVETYYIMQNLPKTSLPVVLAEHNIEYQVYKKYVDQAPLISRPILSLDIAKIKKEEESFWKKATRLIAVSKADQEIMESAGSKSSIVANGVDIEKFGYDKKVISDKKIVKKILFIGDFKWIQNRDSISWIIKDIWPLIKSKDLNVKLWIVGRSIPDSIKKLTDDPEVILDEESSIRSTEELFKEAYLLLAPIRVGGGTSYKILEAMSCGTPVVTTELSADAIMATDGLDLLAGETSQEIADKTINLFKDKKLYEKIAKNGREIVVKNYTWGKIAKDLENVYKSVL